MSEQKALTLAQAMSPATFEQAMEFANRICNTEFVPKAMRGQAGMVLAALQFGAEIGLQPMSSLTSIAVINGHPSVWGDAMPAICMSHPKWGGMKEWFDEDGTAHCRVTRIGEEPHEVTYGDADAQQAKLKGKEGTWQTNPRRMKQMRARSFALRDKFPDALKGLISAEEAQDIDEPKIVGGGVAEPITDGPIQGAGALTAALDSMDPEAGERPKETAATPAAESKAEEKPEPPKAEEPKKTIAKTPQSAPKQTPAKPAKTFSEEEQKTFNLALDELAAEYEQGTDNGRRCWGQKRKHWESLLGVDGIKMLDQERVKRNWEQP